MMLAPMDSIISIIGGPFFHFGPPLQPWTVFECALASARASFKKRAHDTFLEGRGKAQNPSDIAL